MQKEFWWEKELDQLLIKYSQWEIQEDSIKFFILKIIEIEKGKIENAEKPE